MLLKTPREDQELRLLRDSGCCWVFDFRSHEMNHTHTHTTHTEICIYIYIYTHMHAGTSADVDVFTYLSACIFGIVDW